MAKDMESVTAAVVKMLYDAKAYDWSIQDKGVFIAAVKLQLAEKTRKREGTGES